jgi:hypothetical protein
MANVSLVWYSTNIDDFANVKHFSWSHLISVHFLTIAV